MINFDLILASCISYIQGMAVLTLWKLMPGIWSQCWCCVPERYVVFLSRGGIIGLRQIWWIWDSRISVILVA